MQTAHPNTLDNENELTDHIGLRLSITNNVIKTTT